MSRPARRSWLRCALAACALSWGLGCTIEDRKVSERDAGEAGEGGGGGRAPRAGTSGRAAAGSGGRGGAGSGGDEAGKGGAGAGGRGGAGGSGGAGGNAEAGKGGGDAAGAGGGGGSSAETELMNATAKFAETQCNKLGQCMPFVLSTVHGNVQTCRMRLSLALSWTNKLPDIAWTAAKVDACRANIEAQSCRQYVDDDTTAECLVPGKRQNGSPCNSREQCVSRFCATNGYDCGMCAAAPAEGANCVEDVDCPDRTICICADPTAPCAQRLCIRTRNEGESCALGTPCGPGLNCLNGRCQPQPNQVGASCSIPDGVFCDTFTQGLACNGATCVKLTASDTCEAGEYCRQPNSQCTADNTCTPPASDTGTCNENVGCAFPAVCVNGKCQLPGAGTACQ